MKESIKKYGWAAAFVVLCGLLYCLTEIPEEKKDLTPEQLAAFTQESKVFPPYVPEPAKPAFVPYKNKQGQLMTATGPLLPSTASSDASYGTVTWGSTGNVFADDSSYAVTLAMGASSSEYLKATNFGFSIAANQLIDGIEVKWYRGTSSGSAVDDRVRIVKGGTIGSTELGAGATWASGSIAVATFGGPSDLCGETWTYSDINASTFGAAISCAFAGSASAEIDYVEITVYHHTTVDAEGPQKSVIRRRMRDSMWYFRQSTASQEMPLGPFLDTADGFTPMTALTIANTDIKIQKFGSTTQASKNSGGGTHIANGHYYAVFDATDTDTIGSGRVSCYVSGALPVWLDFIVLDEAVYDALFGTAGWGTGTALDAAGVRSAVGLASANLDTQLAAIDDAIDTEVGTIVSGVADIQSRLPAALSGGNMKCDVLAVSGDTTAADNAESFFDGTGYAGTNNVIPLVTLTTTATNLTNAPTAGDFTATMKTSLNAATPSVTLSSTESEIIPNGSGTATAGAATTITLQTALGADTRAVGCRIKLTGGTGSGQCRSITAYVNSTQIATVHAPWTTNPDNTTTYAIAYDVPPVETVCRVGAAFTSSAGTEVRFSAWLERNGQIVTSYAASASCTFTFREQGAGSDLFSVTDSAVNGQGIFEGVQATPGFTSDRLYLASAAITEGGNVFTSRHPISVR